MCVGNQKRPLDSLEFELQRLQSIMWVLGTNLGSQARVAGILNHPSYLFNPNNNNKKGLKKFWSRPSACV